MLSRCQVFRRRLFRYTKELQTAASAVKDLPDESAFVEHALPLDPARRAPAGLTARTLAAILVDAEQDGASGVRLDYLSARLAYVFEAPCRRVSEIVAPPVPVLIDVVRDVVRSSGACWKRAGRLRWWSSTGPGELSVHVATRPPCAVAIAIRASRAGTTVGEGDTRNAPGVAAQK